MQMFEVKAKASVDRFVSIYPTKYVMLYMHCTCMMHHISEFMSLHGSILSFTHKEWRSIMMLRQFSFDLPLL